MDHWMVMGMLPPTPLYVYVQGLTSLGHNQYTTVLFIKASEHPRCGTRFSENCKSTMPSSGWCMMLHDEPWAMDMVSCIPFFVDA